MEDVKSTVDSLVLINNALACESIDVDCNDFACYEKLVIERVLQMVRGLIQAEIEKDAAGDALARQQPKDASNIKWLVDGLKSPCQRAATGVLASRKG